MRESFSSRENVSLGTNLDTGTQRSTLVARSNVRRQTRRLLLASDSAAIPDGSTIRREASRPPALRQASFDENFDARTIVYSSIQEREGTRARLICPAFLNLSQAIKSGTIEALPSRRACKWSMKVMDRQCQILVDTPDGTEGLRLVNDIGTFKIDLRPDFNDELAGQRVLFTKSKNNRLEWILDWISFHRDIHGATAVLLYDNASTLYSQQDLLDAIASLDGIEVAIVVSWPFLFGPTGVGKRKYWDSDFSQYAILEDARWRFLQKAASALYLDVDELVLSTSGESIFVQAEQSLAGVVSFLGDWVYGFDGMTPALAADRIPRFRDYEFVLRPQTEYRYKLLPHEPMRCMPKWAAVPSRCPQRAQWHTHNIKGWLPSRLISKEFAFRHFREISISWKYDRSRKDHFDPARFFDDPIMERTFQRVDWV